MDRVLRFGKRSVVVAAADEVLYPAAKFTREAVVGYYVAAAPFLLPHLRRRPVSIKRYPEGIHGESFWEKDVPAFAPAWVKAVAVPRRDTAAPPIRYVVIDDRATLAWVAASRGLEIHPFLHPMGKLQTPTSVVFDLDPGEGSDILTCIDVARLLKDVLDRLALASFPKVSGSKGLQIHVPLNGNAPYRIVQPFAKAVAELLAADHPKLVVADMAKALRKGRVFIDWSQNADHKTTVAVYSLRAKRHRPYVSMPVTWDELEAARNRKDGEEPGLHRARRHCPPARARGSLRPCADAGAGYCPRPLCRAFAWRRRVRAAWRHTRRSRACRKRPRLRPSRRTKARRRHDEAARAAGGAS